MKIVKDQAVARIVVRANTNEEAREFGLGHGSFCSDEVEHRGFVYVSDDDIHYARRLRLLNVCAI